MIALHCTDCTASFDEADMGEYDICPSCGGDSLFECDPLFTDPLLNLALQRLLMDDGIDSIWPQPITVRPVELTAPEFTRDLKRDDVLALAVDCLRAG